VTDRMEFWLGILAGAALITIAYLGSVFMWAIYIIHRIYWRIG
jgi:hypothetical protein